MTLKKAMKMICDHRAKVKRTKDDWHDGYYDGLTAALLMLSEDEPADTDKPIWEAKDKLTLEELAHELRKIFKFKYLTYNEYGILCIWAGERPKPEYCRDFCFWNFYPERTFIIGSIDTKTKDCVGLDLSEYKDADGNIDYSKCIVEVE